MAVHRHRLLGELEVGRLVGGRLLPAQLLGGKLLDTRRRCGARQLRRELRVLGAEVGAFLAEMVELQGAYWRKQLEALMEQRQPMLHAGMAAAFVAMIRELICERLDPSLTVEVEIVQTVYFPRCEFAAACVGADSSRLARIVRGDAPFPYAAVLASSSGRSIPPDKLMPARLAPLLTWAPWSPL